MLIFSISRNKRKLEQAREKLKDTDLAKDKEKEAKTKKELQELEKKVSISCSYFDSIYIMLHKELYLGSPFHWSITRLKGCFAHAWQCITGACLKCRTVQTYSQGSAVWHAVSAELVSMNAISYTLMLKRLSLTHFKLFVI